MYKKLLDKKGLSHKESYDSSYEVRVLNTQASSIADCEYPLTSFLRQSPYLCKIKTSTQQYDYLVIVLVINVGLIKNP